MVSFDEQLRSLVEEWRSKGMSDKDIIAALRDEIESINDLNPER